MTSIHIIQKSHLYTILVVFIVVVLICMVQINGCQTSVMDHEETFNMKSTSTIDTQTTETIPTVGTSGMWIHMILDESGSMDIVRDSTIHAINQYVEKQRLETSTSQVHASLMKFDGDDTPIVYDRIPLHHVSALDRSTYQPSGWTNLYDAIGRTIQRIDHQLLQSSSIYERPAVLVVILTDGEENQSQYFSQYMIQTMIQQRRDAGWKFIFLGANIDAGNVAEDIGIARNAAIKIDVADTSYSEALDQSTKSWRKAAEKVQTYASSSSSSISSLSYARMMNSEVQADFDDVREQYERP